MDPWVGMGIAFLLIGAFIAINVFMFWAEARLNGNIFDGYGFEWQKVLPFVLWLFIAFYVFLMKMLLAISAVNAVKTASRDWRK